MEYFLYKMMSIVLELLGARQKGSSLASTVQKVSVRLRPLNNKFSWIYLGVPVLLLGVLMVYRTVKYSTRSLNLCSDKLLYHFN